MKIKHILSGACGLLALAASTQALACFTVYDRSNRIIYNAQTPPVDMRYPLHQTLPRAFPGATMVFNDDTDCPVFQARPGAGPNANAAIAMNRLADNPALALAPSVRTDAMEDAAPMGISAPVFERPTALAPMPYDVAVVPLSPPVVTARPAAQPMDGDGMVLTELRDPPVMLYGRLNNSVAER